MKTTLLTLSILFAACSREVSPAASSAKTGTEETSTVAVTSTVAATPPAHVAELVPADVCTAGPDRLCPSDDASHDPSFAAYRQQLEKAVADKNEAELVPLLDEKIRTSFGGGGGIAEFRKGWKTDSPSSPLWAELDRILRLGGGFQGEGDGRSFWAPYVFAKWPESIDAFEHVAAVRHGVPLRRAPAADAAEVTRVDWAILTLVLTTSAPDPHWRHVKTLAGGGDGREGWVAVEDVRSPIGYRAGFSRRGGAWKMDALVSGD